MKRLLTLSIITTLLTIGCGGTDADASDDTVETAAQPTVESEQPSDAEITLSFELTAEQTTEMEALKAGLSRSTFSRDTRTVENAPLFLTMAAHDEDDNVVAASLRAMESLYRARGARLDEAKNVRVDEDYKAVVIARLDSEVDQVLGNAIRASARLVSPAPDIRDAETARKLAALAASDRPEVRYAALNVLRRARDWSRDPELAAPYLAALDAEEAHIVSTALFALNGHTRDLDRDLIKSKLESLTAHADPGVRGRAIQVLSSLPGLRDEALKAEIGARAETMLEDANPFVRSMAARAVGRLDRVEAIPRLLEMLDDDERNTYDITGWASLDGSRARVHHDGSAWSRVDDAALSALSRINPGDRRLRFEYNRPSHEDVEGGITRASAEARAWYAENRAALSR